MTELFETKSKALELAQKLNLPFVDESNFNLDYEIFRTIPLELMIKYQFVPERREKGVLSILVSNPEAQNKWDELELILGESINLKVAESYLIKELLEKGESGQRILDEATEDFRIQIISDEEGEESLSIDRITADTSPIIKLVDSMIFNAIQRRASDIHVETREKQVIIKYRIDGILYQAMEPIDKRYHSAIISRIKVMSELDIAEKRVPQDGRFKLKIHGRTIDFRVSIMPTVHGEDSVIRILDKESLNEEFKNLRLDILGFNPEILKKMRKFISEPYGMVLVTGPTGSGKTTTLYACISEIQSSEDKIVTIEDPVEYQLKGVTQIPVNEKKGLTFARGLRSILRHDPDKIMVGEIRDEETAQIAIQSALTGHLVFTTVHANNVVDVIGRFLNMHVELYNFVSALNCVLAQRLVRVICKYCKTLVKYNDEFLEESGLVPEKYRSFPFYEGKGCVHCSGTGYFMRTAIGELLDMTDTIRTLILEKKPASEIKKQAAREGMVFLRQAALEKVFQGITSLKEANKVTFVE